MKDYLQKFEPQNGIYFLDIDLNHPTNGIDLAELIRKADPQAKIIFITTYNELAPLTLKRKVEALGFIAKDQEFDTFREEIMNFLELAQQRIDAVKLARNVVFTFSIGKQTYNIDMDEVLFVESSVIPHRIVLYTKQAQCEFYGRLYELEKRYPNLFQASRGCLVNLNNAKEIDFSNRLLIFDEGLSRKFSAGRSRKLKSYLSENRTSSLFH